MHRNRPLRIVLLTIAALAAGGLAGCPGRLENPERFGLGTSDSGVASDAGSSDGVPAVFAAKCAGSGCHGATSPALALDLVSDGVAERVLDVPAVGCASRLLVDSADPSASFLLEKVTETAPECGGRMPLLADPLTSAEQEEIRTWIEGL
ncbi:MAG: hypothetical protein M3Y87_33090 [Myxococcota bacterium]|nr:hypothetical protein [Myxococcota bacterium]